MAATKTQIKTKLVEEARAMFFIFIYLAAFFCTITTYRGLVSAEFHVSYFHYGFCLVEALILAKVILIGRLLGVGHRFGDRPLIIPTLYKTATFGLFVLAFSILEHVIEGLWHRDSAAAITRSITVEGRWEILFRVLVVFTALVPFFTLDEIGRVLGEGKLFDLFFRRETPARRMNPIEPHLDADDGQILDSHA